jgi:hypothetical protein
MRTFRRLSPYVVALGLVALAIMQVTHQGLSPVQIGVITKVLVAWLAVIVARFVQDTDHPPGL